MTGSETRRHKSAWTLFGSAYERKRGKLGARSRINGKSANTGVSFGVYQELTEKTEFLFNFIFVLSVVSCR